MSIGLCAASAAALVIAAFSHAWFGFDDDLSFGLLGYMLDRGDVVIRWNSDLVTIAREMNESMIRSETFLVGGIATFACCLLGALGLIATTVAQVMGRSGNAPARLARGVLIAAAVAAIAFCFAKPELDSAGPLATRYHLGWGLVAFGLAVVAGSIATTMVARRSMA